MKPSTPLAKLSPPRLSGALARERLFVELDRLRAHASSWIWAPPGAGKTTLLASYIEARQAASLWFECDGGDDDLASFFHHLSLAAGMPARRSRSRTLPAFTATLASDPGGTAPGVAPRGVADRGVADRGFADRGVAYRGVADRGVTDRSGFARDYFRALFAGLPAGCLVVFDNFEEADMPRLSALLCCAMEQLPDHLNLAVLSRHPPPPSFAHLQSNGRLALMSPEPLRLTLEESGALGAQVGLSREVGLRLHEEAQGWATGMRLLLEQVRRLGGVDKALGADSLQSVFDLFAQQLFERAPPHAQQILLDLALLPSPTLDMACALCGDASVHEVLEHLAQRHLFVERRQVDGGAEAYACTYTFHRLFRAFLRQQLTRTRSAEAICALALRSAQLLESRGLQEEALPLYLGADAWDEGMRLLAILAPRLMRQSRAAQLLDWIQRFPPGVVDQDARLQYWSGWARATCEPGRGRSRLECAYALAMENGQRNCAAQAAAAVIETIFVEYASLEPLERWLPALNAAIDGQDRFQDADSELRALAAQFAGTLHLCGDDASLGPLARRTMALLPECRSVDVKATASAWLLCYAANLGKLDLAGQVLPLAEALLDDAAVRPSQKALCGYFVGWTYIAAVDIERAQDLAVKLERCASDAGLTRLGRYPAMIRFWAQLLRRSAAGMRSAIEAYEASAPATAPCDVSALSTMRALLELTEGRWAIAQQHARVAISAADSARLPWTRLLSRGLLACACVELADTDQAQRALAQMRDVATHVRARLHDLYALQVEAWLSLDGTDELAAQALRRLFATARRHGVGHPMRFLPPWLPRLCAESLGRGIEPGYVKSLVRTYRLPAPAPDLERWPWQIRVHALGGFHVEIDGEPLTFTSKAPRRALALLKAIICLGGREVRDHQLIDALWGEDEADGARTAFNVTLHRLRRLLGDADAIVMHEGCLTLDPQRVWVDAFAFEHMLSGFSRAPLDGEQLERALALYRGPLLPADVEESWSVAARERLRGKYVHLVAHHARTLASTGRGEEAVTLYLHGLDADGLNELFYQGLMRCHHDAGRAADALSLYHRFRRTLHASLGMHPSRETEALARSISSPASREA